MDKRIQPNYLVKNIQNLNEAARSGKLPCFSGSVDEKNQIIIKPYTINSAISNLPVAELNQLHIQNGFKMMKSKDTQAITRGEALAIGTDINEPEKGYIGLTRLNPKTHKQEVIKYYPVSKVKNQNKIKDYNKQFTQNQNNRANIKLSKNEDIKIDCVKVKDFTEFWGKYKTAAVVHGQLICSHESIEVAKSSLAKELNNLIENCDYSKNYSFGKELEKSYQKELRQAFPRPVDREREQSKERKYEQSYSLGGFDR